ncbi:MAG: YkgJ family cysteine cluster protein [Oceanospirillaceae bacterium]|nr:YkgJ family cysteine cluster protein [Oceanospirillaceae bacterium]
MQIDAGEFSHWLDDFVTTMKGKGQGNVPCGDCTGCCTSSKFILIRPNDIGAREVIPHDLLFSAPGLPAGYQLMGYDEQGHCPMFKHGQCSIYMERPETCRQYDCRVMAATQANTEVESTIIQQRIKTWEFRYQENDSQLKANAVLKAMTFIKQHELLFPMNYLPSMESQRAALAIRIHSLFLQPRNTWPSVSEFIKNIVSQYPTS